MAEQQARAQRRAVMLLPALTPGPYAMLPVPNDLDWAMRAHHEIRERLLPPVVQRARPCASGGEWIAVDGQPGAYRMVPHQFAGLLLYAYRKWLLLVEELEQFSRSASQQHLSPRLLWRIQELERRYQVLYEFLRLIRRWPPPVAALSGAALNPRAHPSHGPPARRPARRRPIAMPT